MKNEIEDALYDAAMLVAKEGGQPDNVWVQGYGQVVKDGKPTDAGAKWYLEQYIETGLRPEKKDD